jgi:hypothetical protein
MHRKQSVFALVTLLLTVVGLSYFQPAYAADEPAAAAKVVLKEGSEVKLKFADDLSSKTANEGDPVNLILNEDIKIGDVVVAKAGCKAVGTITNAKKAGMMGRAGELNMRLEHLKVGDDKVKLRGSKGKEGQGKEGTAVALTVLFGPIGLIKHGKNVEVKAGTPLNAFVDDDVALPPIK